MAQGYGGVNARPNYARGAGRGSAANYGRGGAGNLGRGNVRGQPMYTGGSRYFNEMTGRYGPGRNAWGGYGGGGRGWGNQMYTGGSPNFNERTGQYMNQFQRMYGQPGQGQLPYGSPARNMQMAGMQQYRQAQQQAMMRMLQARMLNRQMMGGAERIGYGVPGGGGYSYF